MKETWEVGLHCKFWMFLQCMSWSESLLCLLPCPLLPPKQVTRRWALHHFIWVDLWQLSGLLTLLPPVLTRPSALLASSPSLSFLSKVKALLKHLVNHSYLKVTSTTWSFGKEYSSYPADVISVSQLALMDAAYAQGLVCSALGCNRRDSQMEN